MAKQERRIFDKDVQVWVHRYENLRNMAHWHFENELVVCQEGAAEIMLDGIFYTLHQCCFSKRMRKVFRKNEKSMLQNCNKKAKRKGRLQRVKKPM